MSSLKHFFHPVATSYLKQQWRYNPFSLVGGHVFQIQYTECSKHNTASVSCHSVNLNTEERVNNASYWSETSLTNPLHRSTCHRLEIDYDVKVCGRWYVEKCKGSNNKCLLFGDFSKQDRFPSSSMGTERIGLIEGNKHVMLSAAEASCRISYFINKEWKLDNMRPNMWSIQQCGHHWALKDLVSLEKKV